MISFIFYHQYYISNPRHLPSIPPSLPPPALLFPATGSFSTLPSAQPVSLSSYSPSYSALSVLSLSVGFLSAVCEIFFPLRPYHLTLMRVLIIYTQGEKLEPTRYCIEAEETEREGGREGGREVAGGKAGRGGTECRLLICTSESQKYSIIQLQRVCDGLGLDTRSK